MHQFDNRPNPLMQAGSYKTYQIAAPLSTHFRPGTCAEVGCDKYLNGWKVRADVLDPQMLHTATHCGRKYTWEHVSELENWLVFEPGQPCFQASSHRARVEREEIYIVRDGDHRGNPRGTDPRRHASAADWQDDFANHQDAIAKAHEAG